MVYLRAYWDESRGNAIQLVKENRFDSLVLFYYFGYLDGDGSGKGLHRYFRGIAEEAQAWRAFRSGDGEVPRPGAPSGAWPEWAKEHLDELLAGRSDEELKEEIDEKFRAMGVRFESQR